MEINRGEKCAEQSRPQEGRGTLAFLNRLSIVPIPHRSVLGSPQSADHPTKGHLDLYYGAVSREIPTKRLRVPDSPIDSEKVNWESEMTLNGVFFTYKPRRSLGFEWDGGGHGGPLQHEG